MTFRTNLTRLFTWATTARRPFRKSLKGRALFAPMADALEDRRLMTLNVWIDNLNALNVQADDNSLQNLEVDYNSSTTTYTITSFNSLENFAIITDTSTGLTITKTDYDPISGNQGFLTIVEASPGNLVSIAISTGDNKDTVNLGSTPASLYVNTGGGADLITVSTNPGDTNIILEGGSGIDSLINTVSSSTSATIGQDIYGSPLDSTLSLSTNFDRNTSSSTAQTIFSSDIENVTNFISGSTADIDVTVNGADGSSNGNLGNTSLQSVSTIFLTGNSIVTSVLGYSSNDSISVSASNAGFSSFVGIQGTGLPQTNLYGITPSTGVLRLLGLGGDDTIKVDSLVENLIQIVVEGGAGNDYLSADATILGGDGNDTLQGGLGNDSLDGGAGDNLFLVSPGDDTLVGGSGFDILALSAVTGRNNDFTITQDQAVPATIDINGAVSSVLMTDVDQISVQGSTRDDLLIINGTSTSPVPLIAFLGAGDDTVDATLDSSKQRVTVYGEAGLDYYYSGPGVDIFYGGDDSDTYISSPEVDFFNFYDGGSGENFAYATGSDLSVFQQTSFQYVTSGTGGYVAYSISSIYLDTTGAGTGSYYLEGNAGENQFLVSDGTTNPSLMDGVDSLVLVTGLSVPVYLSGVTVGDVLNVRGNDGSNTYTAMGSNGATLNFLGGAGINQFNILPGATAANFIGTANDSVNLAGSTVGDLVTLSQAGVGVVNLSLNGVTNQVTGAGRFTISTGSGNDTITLSSTDALNITVDGGDNNDVIDSTGVNNPLSNLSILAGDGNDTVTGATLATTVIRAGLGDDTVTLLSSGSVYGDDGFDTINGSSQDDSLYGGAGSDSILGFGGTDLIDGGMGWNILIGGPGVDILMGGADSDTFQWNAGDGFDFITGNGGEDFIDANGGAGGLNQFDVMRYGTAYFMNYNGDFNSGFEADGVPTTNFFSGANSAATANVEDLSGINVQRLAFYFSASTTAAVTVNGSIADNVLTIGASPLDPTLQIISGLPYDFRMTGPVDPTLNTLTVQGLAGNDVITVEDSALAITEVVIDGGIGNDLLTGANQIIGGDGNDTLQGSSGTDILDGGSGNNVFLLSGGTDTFVGGTGFNVVSVTGVAGADNLFAVTQNAASAVDISVNGVVDSITMTSIDLISIQGSSGDDTLEVSGTALAPVDVFASLEAGNDEVSAIAASSGQNTTVYGGAGNDAYATGAGSDNFYGGDDFDGLMITDSSINSDDLYDGGSGFNAVEVAYTSGTSLITAIPSGFEISNSAGTGSTTALNVGVVNISGGSSIAISGTNNDDTIRTFDSQSEIVPPIPAGELVISGLTAPIVLTGVTSATVVDIYGQGGNDTFQSLGNANATVNFLGNSGNDTFEVTQESTPANFSGGVGTDTVHVLGTVNGDALTFQASGPDEQISYNGADAGTVINAEILNVESLAGNDLIQVFTVGTGSGLGEIDLVGGDGNDYISVQNLTSGTFNISGGDGNDTIYGADTPGVMVIHGGAGDDAITLGTAETAAYGDAGNDTLNGSSGADTLSGGDGNDLITGGTGSDQLDAGADDDVIVWNIGDGSDLVEGGTGLDELIVNGDSTAGNAFTVQPQSANSILFEVLIAAQVINSDAIEHVSLTGGTGSDSFNIGDLTGTGVTLVDTNFGTDTVADTVSVLGSALDDHIILAGTTTVAEVTGLAWTVRAENMAFSATTLVDGILIDGGRGYDWLLSGVLMDMPVLATLQGGAGADLFEVNTPALGDNANRVTVISSGEIFTDIIQLNNGRNLVIGGPNDIIEISGTANNDTIVLDGVTTPGRVNIGVNSLNSSNDLTGFTGVIHINAEGGDDTITAGGVTQASTISGGVGNDSTNASGMTVPVTIFGELGDDSITGGSAGDYIDGGNGWNSLAGGLGDDVVNGGSGTDQFTWNAGDGFDYFTGNGGEDYVLANGGAGGLNGFEVLRYSTVYYMQYNGDINQGFESDQVPCTNFTAGAGSTASAKVQDMSGLDVSRLVFDFSAAATAAVSVDGTSGSDNLIASINPYDPTLVEITGLTYQFRMIGTTSRIANALTINGLGGDDTLKSTAAADAVALITLDGGDGNDTLSADAILLGGAGNDTFIVPNGINTIDGGAGFNTIQVDGTNGPDTISVTQGAGTVDLTVNGVTSTNTVSNIQLINVAALAGNDTVTLSGSGTINTNVYAGDGNDNVNATGLTASVSLYGGSGTDSLTGGSGNDFLDGGDGSNQMTGGLGNDELSGGSGGDLFIYNAGDGVDFMDGGGGVNNLYVYGLAAADNTISVYPNSVYPTDINLDINGLAEAILAFSIQGVVLTGGTASDTFNIGDLTGRSVTYVSADFGVDTVADKLNVEGTANNDSIIVAGLVDAKVTGLPWDVTAINAKMNGNLIVDGVAVNGGLGDDYLLASSELTAMVTVTLAGGRGSDTLYANTGLMGVNPVRVTIDALAGTFSDTIYLGRGRNRVLGTADDLIVVNGTVNNDTVSINQAIEGTVISVNGATSTNDLSQFLGVMHVDLLGGNDTATLSGYNIPTSVMGGDGNDVINASGVAVSISIYGGNGNDTFRAGSGDDYMEGNDGADEIYCSAGNDQIFGGADSDTFLWNYLLDGNDTIDGGTGQNSIQVLGNASGGNQYTLNPSTSAPLFAEITGATSLGLLQGNILTTSIQQVSLTGGSGEDSFTVGDLTGTSVTIVTADFGVDTVADNLSVTGTANDDNVYVTGSTVAQVVGLPWTVSVSNSALNGSLLVDGIAVDAGLGNDYVSATGNLLAPVLVTLIGGRGADTMVSNAPAIGVNPTRVTLDASGGAFADTIYLWNGRNRVIGTADDVIIAQGSANNDTVSISQTIEGTVFNVNGATSTNDLSAYLGVIHVDLLGGNDIATLSGYTIPTSVMGGDGIDVIIASGMTVPVSLYGGSGDDTIRGGSANDYIEGNDGSDDIYGNAGNDRIYGGADIDTFFWAYGDGNDSIDGGTGQNNINVAGDPANGNVFDLAPLSTLQGVAQISLSNTSAVVQSTILTASIQQISMIGGSGQDTFNIGDLAGTAVTIVNTNFGTDTVADNVSVVGDALNNSIRVTGTSPALVEGLAWLVKVTNAAMNGNLLVDGISVNGGAGDDTIFSSAALMAPVLVTLNGGVGIDDLRTGTGVMGVNPVRVTINAGATVHTDTIQLFQGRNKVIGSVNDVILVSGSSSNDTIALSQTIEGTVFTINGSGASTNDLSEFEGVIHVNLLGGNDSATLVGYTIPTSVMGGDGNDLVNAEGLLATVSISGGSGNDTLRGSAFADEISGDSGNDDIYAGTGDDTLTGGDGNDDFFWFAGDGLDLIDGGTGDDWAGFAGSTTADNAFTLTPLTSSTPSTAPGLGSGDSNRVLVSYSSAQASHMSDVEAVSLNGGGGCDSYGIGNLQTTDLRVVDVAFSTTAMGGVVSTYATNLPDTITVTADAANQIGVNGLAVPVRIFNANPATAIVVHAGFGTDTIEVDPVAETQAIIVIDGGSGNDTITGGSIIIGGNGNNLLIGTDNPNTIVGGTGSDTIQGLGGSDLLFGDALVTGLDQPGPNCDYFAGLVITPTATGAGDLIEGGEGDDSINGNVGADSLFGGLGNDDIGELTYKGVFFPESGNDAIDGGDGNNCVFSGEGDDSVVVGSGNNLLVLGAGNNTAVTGNGNNTIFAGSGNDTVTTGSGNDVVILGAGNDTAKLGSGNDLAWGEAGNDFIVGALGNDTIYGGSGNDTLWGGTQATKEVKNSSKVVTTPNDGNDVLAGEDGFDKLDGGTANNIMDAGADNIRETMIGSGGWDTAYIHANEGKNQDVLKNHTSRYTLIPYGSMPIAMVPATPTNCDTPITVIIPNPLSGKLAKAPAKPKALPKATGFFTRKPAVK